VFRAESLVVVPVRMLAFNAAVLDHATALAISEERPGVFENLTTIAALSRVDILQAVVHGFQTVTRGTVCEESNHFFTRVETEAGVLDFEPHLSGGRMLGTQQPGLPQ
jgi:hypothetical protein